jgi:acyl carrier protein
MSLSIPDHDALCSLIAELLSRELKLPVADVKFDAPFTQYGLDSVAALTIAGDLEDQFSIELPSTLLWDCPTIKDLAEFLHSSLRAREDSAAIPELG